MARRYAEITYTDTVKSAQLAYGARGVADRMAQSDENDERLGAGEVAFIAGRDGFYLASVGEGGWPYVQFRGGPVGFLRVLDDRTLGYADFRGNMQYLTMGNVEHDNRVSLFLMDYPRRRRLKILARTEIFDAAVRPDLIDKLADPNYRARVERAVIFRIAAFDWNCPQHITPRFTEAELADRIAPLRQRIKHLEALLADLGHDV